MTHGPHLRFAFLFLLVALSLLALGTSSALAQDDWDDWEAEFEDEQAIEGEEPVSEEGSGGEAQAEQSSAQGASASDREQAPDDRKWDTEQERRFRTHSSFFGPTGGIRLVDGAGGAPGTFRVQLVSEFFLTSDFLVENDDHDHVGGSLSLNYTIADWLEVFGSLYSISNSNDKQHPQLIMTLGDLSLGAKLSHALSPVLTIGGDLTFGFPTSGELGPALDALGFGVRALGSADLRGLDDPFPLVLRANLQYVVDRSENLIDDLENARYQVLAEPSSRNEEIGHLITRVERYGLQINRTDFVHIGLGGEMPLRADTDFYIHPLLEWTWAIPINRQGYVCPFILGEDPVGETDAIADDSCLEREGIAVFPMDLTLGVRVLPPVRGLSGFLAVDIGLTGTGWEDAVRELAQNEPYKVMLGASYTFDTRPPPAAPVILKEIPKKVEVPADRPPRGRIRGIVVTADTGEPIGEAKVEFPGRDLTPLASTTDGRFVTYEFPPNEQVELSASAPGFLSASCAGKIGPKAEDGQVECKLARARVQIEESEIQILEKIHFAFDSDEILPESFGLMNEIAAVLRVNPQVLKVEIQGHTDNVGTPAYNLDLSERRASSVREWLVNAGVEPFRLESKGYGLTVPLVPNTTDENRAINRRVQFIIKERSGQVPVYDGEEAIDEHTPVPPPPPASNPSTEPQEPAPSTEPQDPAPGPASSP